MVHTELSIVYLTLFVVDMAIFGVDEVLIGEIKIKLSSHFEQFGDHEAFSRTGNRAQFMWRCYYF